MIIVSLLPLNMAVKISAAITAAYRNIPAYICLDLKILYHEFIDKMAANYALLCK